MNNIVFGLNFLLRQFFVNNGILNLNDKKSYEQYYRNIQ
jgi:hypothetical protein